MRVAPLGAWFAEDIDKVIHEATLSAEVTHTHHEGVVGAVAVALAASWVVRRQQQNHSQPAPHLLPWVISHLENSEVKKRLEWAATYPLETWQFTVASEVGSGHQISAQDTVPFCLWMAAAQLDNFCEAMWTTARVGGDIDTNCAIIGGIVALNVGQEGFPEIWKQSRETLKW
ncbi:MAG: ADP-ribosylglycohydrolase family protein [Planctomycetaceae bacterium]|nr:ADP-ribosylglycohydrolase family protein [Planctomycetaceae bacterium]